MAEKMNDEELATEVAASIADEIGDYWRHDEEMPELKDRFWGPNATPALPDNQAVFTTKDGRIVTVTVSVTKHADGCDSERCRYPFGSHAPSCRREG